MASNTSWQVKKRYNDKVYKRIAVDLDKELVEAWESHIKQDGISKSEFIRNAIRNYLGKSES